MTSFKKIRTETTEKGNTITEYDVICGSHVYLERCINGYTTPKGRFISAEEYTKIYIKAITR